LGIETNDLIYEGIATNPPEVHFSPVFWAETNDLIYEGIATLVPLSNLPIVRETNDLIYEGIATGL